LLYCNVGDCGVCVDGLDAFTSDSAVGVVRRRGVAVSTSISLITLIELPLQSALGPTYARDCCSRSSV